MDNVRTTDLMVTFVPQMDNLLNVPSAAFSAAPRVVNWTNAHPDTEKLINLHIIILVSSRPTLLGDQCNVSDLSIRVECTPDVSLLGAVVQTSNIESGDHPVLGRIKVRHGLGSLEDLLSHGIIEAVVTILHVLSGQWVIRVTWLLMSVGTLLSSFALSLHPE